MRTLRSALTRVAGVAAGITIISGVAPTARWELSAQNPSEVTRETIEQWRTDLSNWGRGGRWARRAAEGAWATGRESVGLHASVAPWLRERGVAMLGSDYTNDVLPSGIDGVTQPIHLFTIVTVGMLLFDDLDLEAVADVAVQQGRWEFMLVAAPLAVPGGTGAPLNPVAIF